MLILHLIRTFQIFPDGCLVADEDPLPNEEDDISTLENNSTTHNDLITINVMNEHGEPIKDQDKAR